MKKILFSALCLGILSGTTYTAYAQEDRVKESKEEEIVIRKKGDKNAKVTVEMKDDEILINGKPMAEFEDENVSVTKRQKVIRDGNRVFFGPGDRGGDMQIFNDDNDKEEARPFLGVTTEKEGKGVKVTSVAKGSTAEKAGLKEGDVITKLGGKKISDPEELMDAVTSYKPKEEVKIHYERNGRSNEVKAALGERKERRIRSFSFNDDRIPHMEGKMFKDFNFEMPPIHSTPGQPFNKFRMPGNKRLGVRIEDKENDGGAKITSVEEGSAAEKAGLKKDDIITDVAGKKVNNVNEVREEILHSDKTNYTIKAKRNGIEMNFEIKIPKKINSADL